MVNASLQERVLKDVGLCAALCRSVPRLPDAWRVSPVAPSVPSPHPPPAPLTILPANERQEAGRAAWLLADLAASGSLQALEIILQLGVQVLRVGGRGPRAPGLSDQ